MRHILTGMINHTPLVQVTIVEKVMKDEMQTQIQVLQCHVGTILALMGTIVEVQFEVDDVATSYQWSEQQHMEHVVHLHLVR